MTTPSNPQLWARVKREISEVYKTNSAYRSGAMVQRYKELGGTFEGKKTTKGLTRWFKEDWQDVGGRPYPVYRPTKRITKDTPLTPAEIDPQNLRRQIEAKQTLKTKVLPPFKKR